jgi:hypothetical protein
MLSRKCQMLVAFSVGAAVGFALVWSSLSGFDLSTPPLAAVAVPMIRANWRSLWAVRENYDEMRAFLECFGYAPQPAAPNATAELYVITGRRRPTLMPDVARSIDRVVDDVLSRRPVVDRHRRWAA